MANAGDIIQLTFRSVVFNQRVMLTHYYRLNTSVSGSDLDFLITFLNLVDPGQPDTLGDMYRRCLPTNVTMQETRAQIIYPVRTAYHSYFEVLAGTWAAPATVPNLAAALTLKTIKAGRNQKATKHIGPLAPDAVAGGGLSGSFLPVLGDLADQLIQSLTLGTGQILTPIIYHKDGDGPAQKYDPVTGRFLNPYARVMRRRTVGLGE